MNFTAVRGKNMPCLPSHLLPVLLSSHMNVKKCNQARLSPKEGKKKAPTCAQREQSGNTFWDLRRQDLRRELLVYLTWVVNQKSALQEYVVVVRNCWWNQVIVWCCYDSFQRLHRQSWSLNTAEMWQRGTVLFSVSPSPLLALSIPCKKGIPLT